MSVGRHVVVGGVRVATASRDELVRNIIGDCLARRADRSEASPRLLFDSNGHAISLAARDPDYRQALDEADLIHADGGFVVIASRWLAGARVVERSATTDLIHDLGREAEKKGVSFYLLGGTEAVNRRCAERLTELYPRLILKGRRHGFFGEADEARVLSDIAEAKPDILWIGLGKPKEQIFVARNRSRIKATWVITCGGCFNYIAGAYSRAPQWMQRASLEWLYRAFTDPKLFWRYAITSPHAIWLALVRADRWRSSDSRSDA